MPKKSTLKFGQIIRAQGVLKRLANVDLPLATSLKVLKVCRDTQDHTKLFQEKHKALFDTFGEKGEGDQIIVPEKKREEFNQELENLLETEVELEFDELSIDAFGDLKLKASELEQMSWMIAEA